jgi:hypothetical protein
MGLFKDDKPFIRQDKFNPWERQGWSSFERIIRQNKGLSLQNKKHIMATMKKEFRDGRRIYNFSILNKFKKLSPLPNSYSLSLKLKKALHADPKTGLSPEQIKRNINVLRYQRGDFNLDEYRMGLGGAGRREKTRDTIVNKEGRVSSGASTLRHDRYNPMGRINVEGSEALATSGGEKYQDSVGQFAGVGKGKKLDSSGHVSIMNAVESKSKVQPKNKVTNLNDFKDKKMGGGNPPTMIPFSKAA